jgi:NuA3 HAT complex component NTO1
VINAERKKEQSGPVSYEMFEIIMDKLEKEWFNLVSTSTMVHQRDS